MYVVDNVRPGMITIGLSVNMYVIVNKTHVGVFQMYQLC